MNIQDICKICGNEVTATFDAVETPDGWAHHSCLIKEYDMASQTAETPSTFAIVGFKHVTEEGIVALWQHLDNYGTVGLLFELSTQEKTDLLMQTYDFDYTTYIKAKFNLDERDAEFDDILMDLHDELVTAITVTEMCFVTMQNSYIGKHYSIFNFSEICNMAELETFDLQGVITLPALSKYCAEHCHETVVRIRITASGNGYHEQVLYYTIAGAEDFNIVETLVNNMAEIYEVVVICHC